MRGDPVRIHLEPLAVELEVARGGSLVAALAAHGVEFPCGGMGECGGCGVRVLSGLLAITEADRSILSEQELAAGWRLACQARAESPLVIECAQWKMEILADTPTTDVAQSNDVAPSFPAASLRERVGTHEPQPTALNQPKDLGAAGPGSPTTGLRRLGGGPSHLETGERTNPHQTAIAIDLGTTTIAAQLLDLATGAVLGVETMLNPQAAFGSDVMSRIGAALEGHDLASPIRAAPGALVMRLAAGRESQVAEVLLVGNTVMHHLFCGLSVEPLSHVPFASPHLGEQHFTPRDLAWNLPAGCTIRFARCIGGFVGSDILAGIVAAGIAQRDDLTALVDLGTNGEIAIGNRDGIVCASAAAGPAFEAGAIRMGMRAVTGAIAYVALRDGKLHATVIGDAPPRGICGSGVVDVVAAGLRSGAILRSGRIANGTKFFPVVPSVVPPVVLHQSDIRELQLAKAAIAAGFRLLLKNIDAQSTAAQASSAHLNQAQNSALKGHDFSRAVTNANERRALAPEENRAIKAIHLAGAFGNYVQIESAIRIGLLEFPHALIHAAGNTALRGAKILLLAGREPSLPPIEHISLAADPAFQDEFAACMTFPGDL